MAEIPSGFTEDFEHRDALLAAALAEFIAKGYYKASINAILKAAGMSKGQFYYHFNSKEGLYLSLIGVLIERKQAFLASVMQPEDFQQDLFGIVKTQIRYGLEFARAYPAISQFSESFIREQGSPIYDRALAAYNFQDNGAIDQLIEAAHQRGDLRGDLPLSFVRHVFGYLLTHAVEVAGLDTSESFEERLDHLIAFMRSGLAAGRRPAEQYDDGGKEDEREDI
ncbi:MAG: TetR/AcrR family transcriptional regulator [Chloroflexi bacterium]|nr:TetR/AcrR family transcriptional regulator [Chloroflexota bacterium]